MAVRRGDAQNQARARIGPGAGGAAACTTEHELRSNNGVRGSGNSINRFTDMASQARKRAASQGFAYAGPAPKVQRRLGVEDVSRTTSDSTQEEPAEGIQKSSVRKPVHRKNTEITIATSGRYVDACCPPRLGSGHTERSVPAWNSGGGQAREGRAGR